MTFVSGSFLLFTAVVVLIYFAVPKKMQWAVLLAASYVFYFFSSAGLIVYLMLTTAATWFAGRCLGKINETADAYLAAHKADMDRKEKKLYKTRQTKKKRRIVLVTVILNLGILIVLKYSGFLAANVNRILGAAGIQARIPVFGFLLPLGISFYTLQSIGYLVDLYREEYAPDRNLAKFALFLSFFPQIVQGPIARHDQLAHQLYESHSFDYDRVTQGAQLILWGFMKKLILADRVGILVNTVFDSYQNYSGVVLFIGAAAYGLQVYADFSGGMDIARGVAQIFGIDLVLNFERPYFACSISEFWRRWHITLGSWMRDYVFYPLSLSKLFSRLGKSSRKVFGNHIGKKLPTFLSMFIVFMLVGVWHGSSWKYIAYGFWNGIIISGSIILEPVYAKMAEKCRIDVNEYGWKFICMLRTFVLCTFGRFFSRAVSCRAALSMFKNTLASPAPWLLTNGTLLRLGLDWTDYLVILVMIFVLLAVGILQERGVKIRESIAGQNIIFRWMIYLGALMFLVLAGIYGPGYSASEFIYQQF